MVGVGPRFSVVLPVRDRADSVARATVSVLAQTLADLELVVVDGGSDDGTLDSVRLVADRRVRVLDDAPATAAEAIVEGLVACRGDHVSVIDADTVARPHWLARCVRLIGRNDARVVFCGGQQHHRDGSLSSVSPAGTCSRPGAFTADRRALGEVLSDRPVEEADDLAAIAAALGRWAGTAHTSSTPEALLDWYDTTAPCPTPGDEAALCWAREAVAVIGGAPVPDLDLLARYATVGGMAAARLGRHADARVLLDLARRLQPGEWKPYARWLASRVPVVSDRVLGRPPS
jgi:glycosyltransferase involved in cell wall biosynthesis